MNLLIVCTGNICRSQLSASYLSYLLEVNHITDVLVETAGIKVMENIRVPRGVREVANHYHLTLGREFGRQINNAMIERADLIIVMEYYQATYILDLLPKALNKIKIIGKYDPLKKLGKELKDPQTFDFSHCDITFQEIRRCIDNFFKIEIVEGNYNQKSTVRHEEGNSDSGYFDFQF